MSIVPPLVGGERLTRDEFERRYDATPGLKKAELIEGVVYVTTRVSLLQHGAPHAELVGWLGNYRAYTPGVRVGDNASVRLDLDNEPQPDGLMLIQPARGGQARVDTEGYIVGAPELVAEVTAGRSSIDLNTKFRVYRRNGVREYIVWRVQDRAIDWFVLRQGQYVALPLTANVYRSEAFPGLWLAPDPLVNEDLSAVLQTLPQGLAGPEHAAFVAQLQAGPAAP